MLRVLLSGTPQSNDVRMEHSHPVLVPFRHFTAAIIHMALALTQSNMHP
jgi:hypothetical protein